VNIEGTMHEMPAAATNGRGEVAAIGVPVPAGARAGRSDPDEEAEA
jgi:hypothetical protein